MQGLDIETTALDPEAGKVHLVQIRNGRHGRVYDGHDPELPAALRKLDKAVAHNATFERSWIAHHYGLDLEDLDDTMIMSQVLYTGTNAARAKQFSHSLQAVVKRELKRELDKSEQDGEWADEDLTPEQIRYAARDAHVLPDLAETLMGKIERAGLRDVYELERRVSHVVAAMERYGVAIHTDRLEAMIEEATQKAETLKAELAEEWTINPGSSKQLIEHFGLDERADWPKTDKGAPSTNQEAMKGLLAEEESVAKWLEWKEVEKIRSTTANRCASGSHPQGVYTRGSIRLGLPQGDSAAPGRTCKTFRNAESSARGCAGSFGAAQTIACSSRRTTPRSSCGWRPCGGRTPTCRRRSSRASTCTSRRPPRRCSTSSRGRH